MSNSFSFSSGVFGFVAGGISLLAFVAATCRLYLPSKKIKVLETLLHETENTFKEAVEDGLLVHEFVERTQHRLTVLKERTCSLRARAYTATTLWKDYAEFFNGTSKAIGRACQSVKNLRAEVITSSEERRRRLMQVDLVPRAHLPVLSINREAGLTPNLSFTEIARPRSCPPALPVWRSVDTPKTPVEGNPFGDPSRDGSDVWIADVQNLSVNPPYIGPPRV